MNVLFIGDVFGEAGIDLLEKELPLLRNQYKINLVIVNGENASYGRGMHYTHYQRFMKMGVNLITMGNHTFSNVDIKNFIDKSNVIRPANIPTNMGKGYKTIKYNDKTFTVINILGRSFMSQSLDCPFKTLDKILDEVKSDYYLLDIHAEATAEKIAIGLDFDGKIDAIVGTHTHVQTADERILPKGSMYITDVGMTGPLDGVIGNCADKIIDRFRTGVYEKADVMPGRLQLNGVILQFGDKKSIKRIHIETK